MAAEQMSFGTSRSGFVYQPTTALSTSLSYTFSIWALLISGNPNFYMGYYNGATAIAPGPNETGPFTATTTWTRYGPFTFTTGAADTTNQIVIQNTANDADTTTAGVIAFWGSQLELGTNETTWFGCQGVAASPPPPPPPSPPPPPGPPPPPPPPPTTVAEALPAGGGSGAGGQAALAGNYGGGGGGVSFNPSAFNPASFGGNLLIASDQLDDPAWQVFPTGSVVVSEFSNQFSLQFG